jgi:flagellar motility protein MotE (MotC chaperone)
MVQGMSHLRSLFLGAMIAAVYASTAGFCLVQKKAEAGKAAETKATGSELQQFCSNNAAVIGDARIGWQTSRLLDLEAQIRQRLAELEARKAEYVAWLRKRDDALRQATDNVAGIYARMRPEAAALQLAAMDDAMAAAILAKISSRTAGAILNEMEVGRAAHLTRMMAGPEAASDGKKS